ncbi:MAG TPA: YeeE/YedE thiosulfate transporter family protein [Rubrivivax sp.]|nr:YeeE/YedE thiosulfate transporter family protein [Rubrivivax sp.]
MLTQLDPASHWLAGQITGIHLFTLAGGLVIGAAAVLLYHSIGRIAGVSGILFAGIREGGLWRLLFLGGIVLGAGLGAYLFPTLNIVSRPSPGIWILTLSGLLVGWGTRQGGGCTSGHGVCGLGRLAPRSLVAVLVFMAAGIFKASLLRHWLGVPA